MKKVFALFIVLAIMCTFTATVFAEDTQNQEITYNIPDYTIISSVEAKVVLPVAGEAPSSYNEVEGKSDTYDYYIYEQKANGDTVNVLNLKSDYRYKDGVTYRLLFEAYIHDSDYSYRYSRDTKATINGIDATVLDVTPSSFVFAIDYVAHYAPPSWTLTIPANAALNYPQDSILLGDASISDVKDLHSGRINANMSFECKFVNTNNAAETFPYVLSNTQTGDIYMEPGTINVGYYSGEAYHKLYSPQITISKSELAAAPAGAYKATFIYSSEYSAEG